MSICLFSTAWAFQGAPSTVSRRAVGLKTPSLETPPSSTQLSAFARLPNPFFGRLQDPVQEVPPEFEATAAGLIRQARRVLSSDLGILESSLLSEDFCWTGPFGDLPLSKTEYLAAGRFFDIRAAFPDLDFRAHDFRIDTDQERTVRLTCRVTGSMRGALRLRDGDLPPTGKTLKCPPEAVTIAFDEKGKVVKLCTGFVMDRQVGNTRGATGVMAAAMVAGQPPSDWDIYPAPAVIARFFGRPVTALKETKAVLAPFPETVMIQLAKGILATNMASEDSTLLVDSFEYSTPYEGPVRKDEFLRRFAAQEFDNVDPDFAHFRVDPFDPFRVWVDVVPAGPEYQGAPQAMSFTFDDDGFCTRVTSAYVMDPTIGNGGGLGGREGYLYASDQASLPVLTRPWGRVIGRVRKKLLSPLTGIDVDDFSPPQKKVLTPRRPTARPKSIAPSSLVEKLASFGPDAPVVETGSSTAASTDPARQARREELEAQKKEAAVQMAKLAKKRAAASERKKKEQAAAAEQLKKEQTAAKLKKIEAQRAAASQKLQEAEARRTTQSKAAAERKSDAEARRKEQAAIKQREREAVKNAALRTGTGRQQAIKKAAEERKAKAAAAAKAFQRKEAERAQNLKKLAAAKELAEKTATARQAALETAAAQRDRQRQALETIANAVSRATISLFGLGPKPDAPVDNLPPARTGPTKKAPFGVPTIRRWRKNFDGSITGLVKGSRIFADGDKITTSAIASGNLESGEIVRTGSGSRYFLD